MSEPEKTTQQELSSGLDTLLRDLVCKGTPLMDKEGNAVTDDEGHGMLVPPSAQLLSVARHRCRDLGMTKVIVDDKDPLLKLASEVGYKPENLRMPDMDAGPDAALPEKEVG